MVKTWIIAGIIGFGISLRLGKKIDQLSLSSSDHMRKWLENLKGQKATDNTFLPAIIKIISYIRSGKTLETAIQAVSTDCSVHADIKEIFANISKGNPGPDPLSQFFSTALDTGTPILKPLQEIQKIVQMEKNLKLKIMAASSQGRAQAEVLSWLPWVLSVGVVFVNPEWAGLALKNPISWFCWSFSFFLCGIGKKWIAKILAKTLKPQTEQEEILENQVPGLVLRLISLLSIGRDIESALDSALLGSKSQNLLTLFKIEITSANIPEEIRQLRNVLHDASSNGSPIR